MTETKKGLLMEFSSLYEKFFIRIYNYACYRCNNTQEAEDLTACIFEKLYKKFDSYEPKKAPLEAWAFTIAHSVSIDFFRRKKICAWFSLKQEQEEALFDSSDNPHKTLEQSFLEKQLRQALQSLSQQEKELVNLHYYQHLKQAEIAAITGLTQSNVGVLLHRAVKKLKSKLGKEYENR